MSFPKYIVTALCMSTLLLSSTLSAQDRVCGTTEVNEEVMRLHPEKRAIAEQLDRDAQEYSESNYGQHRGVIRVIPIVFHIIHNNGSENISKEQVLDAVRIINEDFRGQNSDLSMIVDAFTGVTADSEIEFRLAKKDPQGNCTDGITRTVSALTFSAGENVKSLISWNTARYLNVWVVQTIASGAGGYAYYPGNAPSQSQEGIVVRNSQLGSIGTSSGGNFAARTLSHEIGHYMNLRHVWGNSNNNAEEDNCNDDDNVNDTPNTIGSDQNCILTQVSCGSLDNVQNYMDYSTCARMFTQGQKSRMQAALLSANGLRNNLWTATNLNNTGTNNGFTAPCAPNVQFLATNTLGCEGLQVQFAEQTWGADEDNTWSWNWSFPGGSPSSSTERNPVVTYSQPGSYSATLTVSTGAGSVSETQNSIINVGSYGEGQPAPLYEGMESTSFPPGAGSALTAWSIEAGSGTTWQRTVSAATSGSASARINLRSVDVGVLNSLISPPIDMSAVSIEDARLKFKMAHAPRSTDGSTERLRVYASVDCGESWQIRYTKAGASLSTVGSGTVTGTFTPSANQWREENVNLSSVAGQEHVLLKFEAMSDGQNYLYLDDINLAPALTGVGIEESGSVNTISIVPNPISDNALLNIDAATAVDVRILVTDALGRSLADTRLPMEIGNNSVPLNRFVSLSVPGIYFVSVWSGSQLTTLKVVK